MRSASALESQPDRLQSPSRPQSHRALERLRRLSTRRRAIGVLAFLLSLASACLPARMSYAAVVGHPRIFLDPATLSALAQRASAGTPEWKALRDRCNSYLTGTVEWPDGNNYPDTGSIGAGYQGDGYSPALLNVGLCYQVALVLSPSEAAQYAAKGVAALVPPPPAASDSFPCCAGSARQIKAPDRAKRDRQRPCGLRSSPSGRAPGSARAQCHRGSPSLAHESAEQT